MHTVIHIIILYFKLCIVDHFLFFLFLLYAVIFLIIHCPYFSCLESTSSVLKGFSGASCVLSLIDDRIVF